MDESLALGRVVRITLRTVWSRLPAFAVISVLAHAASVLIAIQLAQLPSGISSAVTTPFAAIVVQAGSSAILTHATLAALDGDARSWDSIVPGLLRWPQVLLANILFNLVLAVGLVALIVPGCMAASRFMLTTPVIVTRQRGPLGSFAASATLTRGSRWKLFALVAAYAVIWVAVGGYTTYLRFGGLEMLLLDPGSAQIAYWIEIELPEVLRHMFVVPCVAVVFVELRRLREGLPVESTAAVFD